MSAACPKCHGTGEVDQMGFLDCVACDAAIIRNNLAMFIEDQGKVTPADLAWAIHQHAVEQERAKARVALFRIDDLLANGHLEAYELLAAELRRIV